MNVNAVDNTGQTPLHRASWRGKTSAAVELLKLGADKAVVAGSYGTPLHQAAVGSHYDTVVMLLEKGCPTDVLSSNGRSVLHFAAVGGNVDIVNLFYANGLNVNAVDNTGETPLHLASLVGKTSAAVELLKLGADRAVVAGLYGTPLHHAAFGSHYDTVVVLLEKGCSTDVLSSNGRSVLHFAAEGGNVDIVNLFYAKGLNVNAVDNTGRTPLHWAAGQGKTSAAVELLKLGADKNVLAGACGSPLHQAGNSGNVDTVRILLQAGCMIGLVDNVYGNSVVHCAARKGAIDVLSYLINYEVDSHFSILNLSNYFGQTPLMHAAVYSSNEVAEWLVQHGADVNVRDSVDTSVIEYGLMNPNFSISKFIDYLRSNDNVVNLAYSEHMITFGSIFGNLSVFDESPLTDIVPLNLSLVVGIYAFHSLESFLAWKESNLCIPDGGKLNPLQVSLVAYFLDLSSLRRKLYKKDFIFKLLSHPKLHYMINEYLPNGMRALDLARYFKLFDISKVIEEKDGREGIWSEIPREDFLRLQPCMPLLLEADERLMSLVGRGDVGEVALQHLHRRVYQKQFGYPNEREMVKYKVRETVLNSKPDMAQVARIVTPKLGKETLELWMEIGDIFEIDSEILDAIANEKSQNRINFRKVISTWLKEGKDLRWSVLLGVLGHYETEQKIVEIVDSLVRELSPPSPVSCRPYVLQVRYLDYLILV